MAPCVTELRGRKMGTSYEKDVVAWANEQAALLRAGKFSALDIEHIAEEIEDVGKSQQRERGNRMAVLLAHLLKWQNRIDLGDGEPTAVHLLAALDEEAASEGGNDL